MNGAIGFNSQQGQVFFTFFTTALKPRSLLRIWEILSGSRTDGALRKKHFYLSDNGIAISRSLTGLKIISAFIIMRLFSYQVQKISHSGKSIRRRVEITFSVRLGSGTLMFGARHINPLFLGLTLTRCNLIRSSEQ